MKRVVFLGAAAATLVQFTKYDLTALQTLGCEIHMVCNMQNGNLSEAALHEYNQTFPSCTGTTCRLRTAPPHCAATTRHTKSFCRC